MKYVLRFKNSSNYLVTRGSFSFHETELLESDMVSEERILNYLTQLKDKSFFYGLEALRHDGEVIPIPFFFDRI